MKNNEKTKTEDGKRTATFVEVVMPEELRLVSAIQVRQQWPISEAQLWRADKAGELPRLRYGKRGFYRLTDLRAFLNRAQSAPPVAVPWQNATPTVS